VCLADRERGWEGYGEVVVEGVEGEGWEGQNVREEGREEGQGRWVECEVDVEDGEGGEEEEEINVTLESALYDGDEEDCGEVDALNLEEEEEAVVVGNEKIVEVGEREVTSTLMETPEKALVETLQDPNIVTPPQNVEVSLEATTPSGIKFKKLMDGSIIANIEGTKWTMDEEGILTSEGRVGTKVMRGMGECLRVLSDMD